MLVPPAKYNYDSDACSCSHNYLLPAIEKIILSTRPERIFDLGCGNGSVANKLSRYAQVTGVDTSESGIAVAKRKFPHLTIDVGSAYDDLASRYGTFPLVLSLEVVEHLFSPRIYANNLFQLVSPGGTAIVSTPYHGYWKNLALAISGRFDEHFTALWDGGHIKFFSVRTLRVLLEEAGFRDLEFRFVGRMPALAKSMLVVARHPA